MAPSGIQSFFNPYIYQLQYLGITHLQPILFVTFLALIQSFAFILAGISCYEIIQLKKRQADLMHDNYLFLAGFLLCLAAPIALSEAGTTFADLLLSVLIIAAFRFLLIRERFGLVKSWVLAGGLIGIATALKLTNGIFALGVLGFALTGPEALSERIKLLALFTCAAIFLFIVVGGSWHLYLWKEFQNPFFPYFNNLFHSPDYPWVALRDTRFLPDSALDLWRYPIYWSLGTGSAKNPISPSSELPFRDIRWIIFFIAVFVFLICLLIRSEWRKIRLVETEIGMLFAIVISYICWIELFGIHRYIVALDILCGVGMLILSLQIPIKTIRLFFLSFAALSALILIKVPDWGHSKWDRKWRLISDHPIDFGGRAIVFLANKPSLYIAQSIIPADTIYVDASGEFDIRKNVSTKLTKVLKQELSEARSFQVKVIDTGKVSEFVIEVLSSYGYKLTQNCQQFRINEDCLRICDVELTR